MISPTVTVGIPNYNGAKYLKYAIESVLSQTYTDFELIISDDGSTDDSLKIIQEYQHYPNVRLTLSKENRGLSYRLNEQIHFARGKYFCRMDADDIMFPNRLQKQVEFLDTHVDVDVVGSSAIVIDENNKILGTRAYIHGGEYCRPCNGFIHPTVMGKTLFFIKNKYSERFSGIEDTELWRRCEPHYVFKTLNEPLLFYRDPLKLRVKTYISRISLVERMFYEDYRAGRTSICLYLFSVTKLKIQKIGVNILDFLGKTSLWVKRHNLNCTGEQRTEYLLILNERTKTTHTR